MSDINVGVGIQVTGDASGAREVDGAIKQVGETAKQVSQETAAAAQQSTAAASEAAQQAVADAGTVADGAGDAIRGVKADVADLKSVVETPAAGGGLKDEVDGLTDALAKLSPEKSKGLVGGLTEALLGLGSGNVSQSLAGTGRMLFNLSTLIPLPGAAPALAAAAGLIAGYFKLIGNSTDEPQRKLNEFGETVDEEMERLAEWAKSEFEWEGIKNANASVRADFDLLKASADAALAAVTGVFNAQSSARVSSLQREAAAAEAAGDAPRAAELKQQVADEQAKAELVKLHLTMTEAKAEAAEQTALLKSQAENNARLEQDAKEATDHLASLDAFIKLQTGKSDAMVDSEARSKLVQQIEAEIAVREKQSAQIASYTSARGNQPASSITVTSQEAIEELRQLAESLNNYTLIAAKAKEADTAASDAMGKSNEEAIKAASSLTELGLKIETLKTQIQAVESAVTPEVSEAARQQAGLMAGAVGDFLESTLTLATTDVEGIIGAKTAAIDALSTSAGDLETAKAAYAKTIALEEIPPVMEETSKLIVEGNKMIREAVEGTGTDAVAAGTELQKGAEEFRVTIVGANTGYKAAAVDLASTSKSLGEMAKDLASSQRSISLEVAAQAAEVRRALAAAESARLDAGLALQQNRNRD